MILDDYTTMWWFGRRDLEKERNRLLTWRGHTFSIQVYLWGYYHLTDYLPVHRNQIAAVQPQMALKTTTNRGVSMPSSRPITPFLAFIGKTTKS